MGRAFGAYLATFALSGAAMAALSGPLGAFAEPVALIVAGATLFAASHAVGGKLPARRPTDRKLVSGRVQHVEG